MKIGFQTIVWWPFRDPLEYRLEVIAAAGFQGVELKEHPDELPPIKKLLQLLEKYKWKDEKGKEHSLNLIGLSGGSLKRRMDYCKDFRPEYLYTDDWNDEIARLLERSKNSKGGEFTLAVHPHVFRPTHRLRTAEELLKENSSLKFVPDTAHLTIVGDDPIKAIRHWKARIAAVHIKDWSPEFGHSAHSYARGFVEPGSGVVDLDGVVEVLKDINYSGWLIAEQDSAKSSPDVNTFEWAKWLAERKLLPRSPTKPPAKTPIKIKTKRYIRAEANFLETAVSAIRRDLESCYESISKSFLELCKCELVTIWTCSPAQELMNLVAVSPEYGWNLPIERTLNYTTTLSGIAIEEQKIRHFDLKDDDIKKQFGCKELLNAKRYKNMVSIPIFNSWNPHHVRLIVNILYEKSDIPINNRTLEDLAVAVGYSTTSVLDEACLTSAAKVNMLVKEISTLEDFVKGLAILVAKLVNCEEVAILLTSPSGNELELFGNVGEEWLKGGVQEWYDTRRDSIEKIWDSKETVILPHEEIQKAIMSKDIHKVVKAACAGTPFVRTDGKVLGLIFCSSKYTLREESTLENFTFCDDDCVILEAIGQAAVSHLEILGEREQRSVMLGRLTHELKVPLVAIRGAIDLIKYTPGARELFDFDYPGDIESWTELMGRLIDNADAFSFSNEPINIKPARVSILRDVIAPAVRQSRLLLRERRFSQKNIHYTKERFQKFPRLWLDRNLFQQVMFNLLNNAIKYADDDRNNFRVEIEAEQRFETIFVTGKAFVIWFRDWGLGIEEDMQDAIFEEGVRGEDAITKNVTGQGLGLWVVRQIIQRHGGEIVVSNTYSPTEFKISLPPSLKNQKPL